VFVRAAADGVRKKNDFMAKIDCARDCGENTDIGLSANLVDLDVVRSRSSSVSAY
jgi:hypothetical protein